MSPHLLPCIVPSQLSRCKVIFCCCCCQTRIGVAIASGERRLPLKQTKRLGLFLVTTSVVRKLVYFLDATSRSHSLDLSTCGEISSACFPFLSRLSTFYEYYLRARMLHQKFRESLCLIDVTLSSEMFSRKTHINNVQCIGDIYV